MAMENVREFLARLKSDESLAEQADDAYVSALLGVAKGAGYDVAEDELRAALDGAPSELPEDELDKVVGGSGLLSGSTFNTVTGGLNFNTAFAGFSFGSFSQKGFSK